MQFSRVLIHALIYTLGSFSIYGCVDPGEVGSVPEISTEELKQILRDRSAVVLDTRPHLEWSISHIPGARNLPQSLVLPGKDVGEVFAAINDGRLPMQDHNTRIIVLGEDGSQAREVVEALAREAF